MSTRRPPIAPKSSQQPLGPVEGLQGQQIVLESHTPSPRKSSVSEHGNSLGATRPRSPRPADVYNAAMAELIEGDGRGLTKIRVSGPSPGSSPGRRRTSLTTSSVNSLNPLSPGRSATATSILDHPGSSFKTLNMNMTFSGVSGPAAVINSASARVLSALDEHRQVLMSSPDSMSSTAPLPGTPPRKATSAPDSQSQQAQMRSAVNPWRSGLHDPLTQPYNQSPRAAALAAATANTAGSPARQYGTPLSPPLYGGLHLTPMPPPQPPTAVAWGPTPATLPPLQPSSSLATAASGVGAGAGGSLSGQQQRRDSASFVESPSPGHVFDSPSGAGLVGPGAGGTFGAALRIATFSRVGSPNSPSTPASASGSQPHTPACSSLKPRPPEAPSSGRANSRKFSMLTSPEARQQQQQQQQQHQQQQMAGSPNTARVLQSATTPPGAPTPDDPPTNPLFRRSLSMGASAAAQAAAVAAAGSGGGSTGGGALGPLLHSAANGTAAANGSLPGTPSASRPTSGRVGSARAVPKPVAALVDAVRSKDEGKLTEVLEALKGPHGVTQGLNERHQVTGRTPLHEAIMTNSVAMVGMLLGAGADPNIGHLTQGPPLLHCAAFGEVDTMRQLLKEGADVHAADVERSTALHFACRGGHLDAARLLLDFGGDLRARNEEDLSPLDLAPPEFPRLLLLRAQEQGAAAANPSGPSTRRAAAATGTAAAGTAGTGAGAAAASPPLPSPPRLGRTYHRLEGGSNVGTAPASDGGTGGGLPVGLSPEPSYLSSARSTPGALPTGRTTDSPVTAAAGAAAGGGAAGPQRGAVGGIRTAASTAAAAAAGGPLCSPTTQIDLSASPAFGPSPVGLAGGGAAAAAVPGPLSRRNSGSVAGVDEVSPLRAAASAPTSRDAGDGASAAATAGAAGAAAGARGAVGAAAAAGGASRSRGAPASPLAGGEGEAVPASPPQLQLPGGVRRQLSRGADLGDIITGFQKEDAEIVRRSLSGATSQDTLLSAVHAAAHGGGHAVHHAAQPHPQPQPHFMAPPGMPAGPSAAALPAKAKHTGIIGTGAAPAPTPAVPVFGRPTWPIAQQDQHQQQQHQQQQHLGGVKDKDKDKDKEQQQQPLLPFALPETAVIRFGTRVQVHAADTASDSDSPLAGAAGAGTVDSGTGGAGAGAFGRMPSGAMAMPSFSTGMAPLAAAAAAAVSAVAAAQGVMSPVTPDQAPQLPASAVAGMTSPPGDHPQPDLGAVGFKPVPATGFTPPPGLMAAAPAPAAQAPPPKAAPVVAAPSRMSGSGEDFAAATPPLVRDDSPVRDRSSNDGAGSAGGAGGGGGRGGGGAVGSSGAQSLLGSRHAPTRTSMLAAQALKRMSNMNASMDAIEVRAAALFRQSTELTTGELAWTQGELLGEGAYGKVYAGLNQQTGELMAVKVLQLVSRHGNKEAVMQQLEALQHEMSLYKKLKNKHVVGYIDAKYDPKTSAFYIFLEYVPGGSISSMLSRFGRFSEELVRNYTRQLLIGLEYLHGSKIVHRDLKGGNVLVSRDGVVKLADFGASKAYRDHTITDCMKSVRGSVFWMAPEVIRGTGYGRRADIWSLGCTVIEMITGKHPWPHLDNQWTAMFTIAKTEEGPPRPTNLSPEGQRFLDKCLQFDPAKRPTAAELLQDPFVAMRSTGGAGGDERLQHSF